MGQIKAAIIGPGLIGIDLMYKIMKRANHISLDTVIGIFEDSEGLKTASEEGYNVTSEGIEDVINRDDIEIYFDATGAMPHKNINAPAVKEVDKIIIDLTPASIGPFVVPSINKKDIVNYKNVNMVTCGGQATVPIVSAVSKVAEIEYAEVVASAASLSAGPGTRQNIDEYTETTKTALMQVGGAKSAKAIIILNPAEPPITMKNTIYCRVNNYSRDDIIESVNKIVEQVKKYVPGYSLKMGPDIDNDIVTTVIEVEGEGDYLPKYAGNLDIMTSAALEVGEIYAKHLKGVEINE